jgi:hypothetical protein
VRYQLSIQDRSPRFPPDKLTSYSSKGPQYQQINSTEISSASFRFTYLLQQQRRTMSAIGSAQVLSASVGFTYLLQQQRRTVSAIGSAQGLSASVRFAYILISVVDLNILSKQQLYGIRVASLYGPRQWCPPINIIIIWPSALLKK